MRAWLVDADYVTEDGNAVVRLWCKDEKGVFIAYDRKFKPYFYALKEEGVTAEDLLKIRCCTKNDVISPERIEELTLRHLGRGVEVFKIFVKHPQHVPKLREEVSSLCEIREADIPFVYRYLIDRNLACMDGIVFEGHEVDGRLRSYEIEEIEREERRDYPDLKVMAFDCEMLTDLGMPDPEKNPIIVIAVKTDDYIEIINGDNEREIIERFVDLIKEYNPGIIVGYNQDKFDWPYIKKRAEKLKIKLNIGRDGSDLTIKGGRPKIAGRLDIDLYDIAMRTIDVKIKKLENIAEFLGKKIDIAEIEAKDIYKHWKKGDREKVLSYAEQDVLHTYYIAEELLPMHYELSRMIRIPLDDVTRSGRGKQVDLFLLSEAYRIGEIAPNPAEYAQKYEGAFVLEPARGLHENVICLDFACHPEDTPVAVKGKGRVRISEVKEGDYILGNNGWHRVKKVWVYDYNGILIDVNGLKCTPNHKIPIFKKNCNQNFVKDKVAIAIAQEKLNGKVIRCKIFDEVSEIENNTNGEEVLKGELAGILLAEGCLLKRDAKYFDKSRGKGRNSHQHRVEICINSNEKEFKDRIKYIFKKLWNVELYEIKHGNKSGITLATAKKEIYHHVAKLLDEIEKLDARSALRGFFEGDGSVNFVRRTIVFNHSAKNKDKLKIVAELLDKLGIGYSWHEFKGNKPMCIIEIAKRDDIVKFATLVGAISNDKSEKIKRILEEKTFEISGGFYDIEDIKVSTSHYRGKVYDLTLEGEPYYFANGIQTHNSMYPSIMISYNISPDTLNSSDDCHIAPEVGHRFRKHPDGFFKRILQMLIQRRRELKKAMKELEYNSAEYRLLNIKQATLKVLTNSFYGYTGWNMARWYCRECAEATTAWGRHFIKTSARIAEEMGFKVLYGDTDSIFVKKDNLGFKELESEVKKLIKRLSTELPVQIEIEDFYRTTFFVEKKRYAGLTTDGRIVVKGLEVRRGDWCELAKKVQREVIETILKEKNTEKAAEYIRDVISKIKNGKIPIRDYIIYKGLTRRPERYESVQAHVKAAKKAAKKGIVYPVGSKIGFVVLKGSGNIGDRAFPSDLIDDFDGESITDMEGSKYRIDKDYYIENQVLPSVMRILERFEYNESQLKGVEQKTLDSFW